MSFLARFGALTEELVSLITATSPEDDPERFNIYRESTLRSLRQHTFLRTNQFQVAEQLRGLDERFRVHSRDKLADALKESLDSLSGCANKFTPDVLHFLLELSDQPTQKSRLADLDALREPEEEPGPKLTWGDIAREDGWSADGQLWRNASFEDSSDEDGSSDVSSDGSSAADDDATLSSAESKHRRTVRDIVAKAQEASLLQRVRDSQGWRRPAASRAADRTGAGDPAIIQISEMQFIREVLFMLSGLPTTLFDSDCKPTPGYRLADVPSDAYRSLVACLADGGRRLLPLRKYMQSEQHIPLLRAFQEAVRERLLSFDRNLAKLQAEFITGRQVVVVVSLISVSEEVSRLARPLHGLADIVVRLREEDEEGSGSASASSRPFRYLELLYEEADAAQSRGDDAMYRFLGNIFFECFEFYLRPIRLWMEEGRLMPEDHVFFIRANAQHGQVPLNSLWQDQFSLVHGGSDGMLHAPRFLQPAAKKIFTTGKSVVVLQRLGRFEVEKRSWAATATATEPPLTFSAVCPPELDLAPFPELFKNAFDAWISSKHHTASATLRRLLFEVCGLRSNLAALHEIYFMSNGFVSDTLSSAIFRHLDSLDPIWKDRFTLTELAREAFSHLAEVHRLSVAVDEERLPHSTIGAHLSVRDGISAIVVNYRLPWPIQLIVQQNTLSRYHTVFTFLLQLSRAIRCLEIFKPLSSIDKPWSDELRLFCNIRSRLLWFTNTLYTYLTAAVLGPSVLALHESLEAAVDIDNMIDVHAAFIKRVISEACLNLKLNPIHECILDVLDLAIRLEQGRVAEAARSEEDVVTSRQSGSEGGESDIAGSSGAAAALPLEKPYIEVLGDIRGKFDKHMRFICSGLRAVARATRDGASTKWDMLAEMLETGLMEQR